MDYWHERSRTRLFIRSAGHWQGRHLKRLKSGILNLPLDRKLECGPFELFPDAEGQRELSAQTSMHNVPVLSASAIVAIPGGHGSVGVFLLFTDNSDGTAFGFR